MLQYRTGNGDTPQDKARVYFTCHPEDFSKYFDRICQDLFRNQDCAVFYTEDMAEAVSSEELERCNLFVVPVTGKLLLSKSRAMDRDVPFAIAHRIPVLPLMMEPDLGALYKRPDRFGELQYLRPDSTDPTEVGYENRLKNYLEAVLVSDALAQQIRDAFDAYIFLSYRKKDRSYANTLMRLIHKHPRYRDVAIWYDEFLVPGESFRENILRMLQKSKAFALLVTPSLLEETKGKPNFVKRVEYDAAQRSDMKILPVEMVRTNRDLLEKEFQQLPPCLDPMEEDFRRVLLEALGRQAAQRQDPMHLFLMGLAYVDGIDMEVDRDRGISLLEEAAQAGLPEAMEKLYYLYVERQQYRDAVRTGKTVVKYWEVRDQENTIAALGRLGELYNHMCCYRDAADTLEQVDALAGPDHPDALRNKTELADAYGKLCDYEKQLQLAEEICRLAEKRKEPEMLVYQNNLAVCHLQRNRPEAAQPVLLQALAEGMKTKKPQDPIMLQLLRNYGYCLYALQRYEEAEVWCTKAWKCSKKAFGEEHPGALEALVNLSACHEKLGRLQEAEDEMRNAWQRRSAAFGVLDREALKFRANLGTICFRAGKVREALQHLEAACADLEKTLWPEHPMLRSIREDLETVRKAAENL